MSIVLGYRLMRLEPGDEGEEEELMDDTDGVSKFNSEVVAG